MDRYLIGVLAVLVALPLFAFPLASPVPQEGQQVRIDARPAGEGPDGYEPSVNYSAMPDEAQTMFDEARQSENARATVELEDAPGYWREHATDEETLRVLVRMQDGPDYMVFTDIYIPGPDGGDVLVRLGSLVASILIGIGGAYLVYQNRGVE